jgi:hypothetical protein
MVYLTYLPSILGIIDSSIHTSFLFAHRPLLVRRSSSDNLTSKSFCNLTSSQSNTSSTSMNEDPISRFCFSPSGQPFITCSIRSAGQFPLTRSAWMQETYRGTTQACSKLRPLGIGSRFFQSATRFSANDPWAKPNTLSFKISYNS